jgi:Cu-Zn family superoxide dismutase
MRVRVTALAVALAAVCAAADSVAQAPGVAKVVATLQPTAGSRVSGTATFSEKDGGVLVTVRLNGLTSGFHHPFYILATGDCSAPEPSAAGGTPIDEKIYLGDVVGDAYGNGYDDFSIEELRLEGPNSVIGRAVVVLDRRDQRASCGVILTGALPPANTFVIAAYNVENWVLMDRDGQPNQPKPPAEKETVFEVLTQIRPDILGIEEMGTTNELAELANGLRERGVNLPYSEWIEGADQTRHVSLLSRFPITERYSRTDYSYSVGGHPMRMERGILDVEVSVSGDYSFRALVVHLKSKPLFETGDQATMRLEEAKLLRSHVGKTLKHTPGLNLIVMGDFNDTPESKPIRTIVGERPFALFDLMPVDSKGGNDTYCWKSRNLFSRIDYMIASLGLSNEYIEGSAHIADVPGWSDASEHRAVYARFFDHDIGEPPAVAYGTEASAAPPPEKSSPPYLILVIVLVATIVLAAIIVYRRPTTSDTQRR